MTLAFVVDCSVTAHPKLPLLGVVSHNLWKKRFISFRPRSWSWGTNLFSRGCSFIWLAASMTKILVLPFLTFSSLFVIGPPTLKNAYYYVRNGLIKALGIFSRLVDQWPRSWSVECVENMLISQFVHRDHIPNFYFK